MRVPLRGVFEKLGANVAYDGEKRTVRATRDQTDIVLTVGSGKALVSGREITLDAPTTLTNGSVLVPLRFVSENLGAEVDWDAASRTVAVQTAQSGGENPAAAAAGMGMTTPPETTQASPPGPSALQAQPSEPMTATPAAGTTQNAAPSAAAPEMSQAAPAAVDTAPETATAGFDWGRWLPWILGALALLGIAAYLMTRGRGGQVIAAKDKRTNP